MTDQYSETLLITGGAGFIGSNFVRLCAPLPDLRLVVFDALTYAGNMANIKEVIDGEKVIFVQGNICDVAAVESVFANFNIDQVVHFAAESHVDRSILGPRAFVETNVTGTLNLLLAASNRWRGNFDGKRFLQVSTDEVYGSLGPKDPAFNEETAYRPNSPYSASKAAADHLVRAWHHTYGFPTIVTNCSNNYGPWQFPEKLIPLMILNVLEGKELPVYGDGRQVRDWLHVLDHCEAIRLVLARGTPGETYCIGGDSEAPNFQIVNRICDLMDDRLNRPAGTAIQLIRHVQDRPGHDRRYAVNHGKLTRELGWTPRFDFEESLGSVVDWYLDHGPWVDAIRSGEYLRFYDELYGYRLEGAS